MNKFKFVLLGGAAMLAPLASLASPTVYIPLGTANEIMIVDAATDKEIGKIRGFKNIHGLSLTPNGEYLVAGSNDELFVGRPKMAGHGKMSGSIGKQKSAPAGMAGHGGAPAAGYGKAPPKTDMPKSAPAVMAKPAGVSAADHAKHHPQPSGAAKTQDHSAMMGGKPKAMAEPATKDHGGADKHGQSTMAKPKGMSDADHKKHHAPAAGGLLPAVGISGVALVRIADNKLESLIKVRGMAHHTFVTPDGKYAVSTHTTNGTISLIDLATKKIFRNIYTGPQPNYVAMTQDGEQMYVSNAGNNTLSIIDTKNWIVSRNILVGKGPEHIVMSPDEKFIYTNNGRDGTISRVSLEKLKVVKTYTIGNNPHGIDISADGETLYASAKKDNKLVALDVKTGKMRTLKLAPAPYHVKVIGNTGKIYVSSRKKPFIWVVDAKQLKVIGKIKVRDVAHQMVVVN
ncbi:MAG: hypothetical protein BMS9Abin25_0018 [Gammaproteobacteria bacterium]|nr:MAG: hypothetical protein BMS9Abin25_0018 [Gammaproteobacteria bacterium]